MRIRRKKVRGTEYGNIGFDRTTDELFCGALGVLEIVITFIRLEGTFVIKETSEFHCNKNLK